MSLEQPVMTFRPNMENALLIEGLRNFFPLLNRSERINLIITWVRLFSIAENINLPGELAQRVLCVGLYTTYTSAPEAKPQKLQTMSKKAGVA